MADLQGDFHVSLHIQVERTETETEIGTQTETKAEIGTETQTGADTLAETWTETETKTETTWPICRVTIMHLCIFKLKENAYYMAKFLFTFAESIKYDIEEKYWVTLKLPQICILRIHIGKVA